LYKVEKVSHSLKNGSLSKYEGIGRVRNVIPPSCLETFRAYPNPRREFKSKAIDS